MTKNKVVQRKSFKIEQSYNKKSNLSRKKLKIGVTKTKVDKEKIFEKVNISIAKLKLAQKKIKDKYLKTNIK